jgi:hypothetical protein
VRGVEAARARRPRGGCGDVAAHAQSRPRPTAQLRAAANRRQCAGPHSVPGASSQGSFFLLQPALLQQPRRSWWASALLVGLGAPWTVRHCGRWVEQRQASADRPHLGPSNTSSGPVGAAGPRARPGNFPGCPLTVLLAGSCCGPADRARGTRVICISVRARRQGRGAAQQAPFSRAKGRNAADRPRPRPGHQDRFTPCSGATPMVQASLHPCAKKGPRLLPRSCSQGLPTVLTTIL